MVIHLVAKLHSAGYIADNQVPWLIYALEKRFIFFFIGIPFF